MLNAVYIILFEILTCSLAALVFVTDKTVENSIVSTPF